LQKIGNMRVWMIPLLLATVLSACSNSEKKPGKQTNRSLMALGIKDSTQFTTIQWLDSANRNFGKISEGQKLEVSFRFKNSGNKPLVIQRVQPSCGCTVAEQPNEPVAPGEGSIIRASFNSEGHIGVNHKTIYVYANTKGSQSNELQFQVIVEKKKW
jgi:hypothetical protein